MKKIIIITALIIFTQSYFSQFTKDITTDVVVRYNPNKKQYSLGLPHFEMNNGNILASLNEWTISTPEDSIIFYELKNTDFSVLNTVKIKANWQHETSDNSFVFGKRFMSIFNDNSDNKKVFLNLDLETLTYNEHRQDINDNVFGWFNLYDEETQKTYVSKVTGEYWSSSPNRSLDIVELHSDGTFTNKFKLVNSGDILSGSSFQIPKFKLVKHNENYFYFGKYLENNDQYLLKFDTNFNLLNSKCVSCEIVANAINDMEILEDGRILLLSQNEIGASPFGFTLFVYNLDFSFVESNCFKSDGCNQEGNYWLSCIDNANETTNNTSNGKIIPTANSKFILEEERQLLFFENTDKIKCGTFFCKDFSSSSFDYPRKKLLYSSAKLKAIIEDLSVDEFGFYQKKFRYVEFEDFSNCGLGSLGLANNNKINEIRIFPNPAQNSLSVTTGGYVGTVLIYDQIGKKVFEAKTENPNKTEINISNLSQGLYMVEFTNDTETHKMKFIKE